jgi:tetratricopeptide (TPR) repeat protein
MGKMNSAWFGWLKPPSRAGIVVLAMMLSVLTGCAIGNLMPGSVVEVEKTSEAQVDDGDQPEGDRRGFTILETPDMDEASRRDFEMAVILLHGQEYLPAIRFLEKVIERSPGVTAPYINIAIAYKHLDKLEEAEAHLQTALSLVPEHPVACNEYGLLFRKTGRFSEARAIYEKALASYPDYLPARRNLGILCDLYLNDLECALEQYELYSADMQEDPQVNLWVADLRARLGRD